MLYILQRLMEHFQQHLARLQQVDQIAKNTLLKYHQKMPEKYANIQATLKLLINLIASFRKRADNHEQELKNRAKIADLMGQIEFHRARITDCERMSAALSAKVEEKRGSIVAEEEKVKQLRGELLRLKTANVKKILELQNLQTRRRSEMNKQNIETRKATWKMKTEYSRGLHTNLSADNFEDSLVLEKQRTIKQLCFALKEKKQVQKFIEQAWHISKVKLLRNEKKATVNGLNGSLMFRMLENEKVCMSKPLRDPKLIIYDVLRAKYKGAKREEKEREWEVEEQEFMAYSPMQVLGVIELYGGVQKLKQAIDSYEQTQS